MENPDNITLLIQSLKHPDEETRLSTLCELAQMDKISPSIVPDLLEILHRDPVAKVRGWAAFALGRTEEIIPDIENALIKALEDETFAIEGGGGTGPMSVSACAMETLISLGTPVVPGIIKALNSHNQHTREQAIYILQGIGPDNPELVQHLLQAIKGIDKDYVSQVAKGVLTTMAAKGIKEAVQGWEELLNNGEGNIRLDAAIALGSIGKFDKKVLEGLVEILKNQTYAQKHNEVRQILVRAGKPAVSYLIRMLEEEERHVRQMSAQILGQIGPDARKACPALLARMQDEKSVRRAAIKALRKVDLELAKKKGF